MITDYSSVVAPSINQDEPEIKLLIAFILPYPIRLNLIHQIHFFNEFKLNFNPSDSTQFNHLD